MKSENNLQELIIKLKKQLEHQLPGADAQYKMAPDIRLSRDKLFSKHKETKDAAVMILLHENNGEVCFILIERPEYNGVHSRQIAFPGGKVDSGESIEEAAIRETSEELGIDGKLIYVLGELTDLIIPTSNFRVVPLLGFLKGEHTFAPDEREVKSMMHVPLRNLFDNHFKSKMQFNNSLGNNVFASCYSFGEYNVWGATAMILSELTEILKNTIKQ